MRIRSPRLILAPLWLGVLLAGLPSWAADAGDKNDTPPLRGALGDFVDKSWKSYANNLYGGALDLADKAAREETLKQIKFYRNWIGRTGSAIKIANAYAAGDSTDMSVQTLAALLQEFGRQSAGKSLLQAAGISTFVWSGAITSVMVTYDSQVALNKERRGVELESLYGGLESDRTLNAGYRAGRKVGEGDPIPVTREAVEHVFRRLLADESFRQRFRTYVTQELQQPFPEDGYWGRFQTWLGGGSQETAAQAALLEQRQQVDQWIMGLLSTLNRRLKAREAVVKAQHDAEAALAAVLSALDAAESRFNAMVNRFDARKEAMREAQKPKPVADPPRLAPTGPTEPQRIASATAQARALWERERQNFHDAHADYGKELNALRERINAVAQPQPPRVRLTGRSRVNGGEWTDNWNDWTGMPRSPEDPLMSRLGTRVSVLRARAGEYDRAIAEVDRAAITYENIGSDAERLLTRYQTLLTDIKSRANAIYREHAPYIELNPPYFDNYYEGLIAAGKMDKVPGDYLQARDQSLVAWHAAEARVDRKARQVDTLEDVFGELDAIIVATPSIVEFYRQLSTAAAESKEHFLKGLEERERWMKAGVSEYRNLEANFTNSFAQIIGATRGLQRVQSGEFWFPRRNGQVQAATLDEPALARSLAAISDPAKREARTAEWLTLLRQKRDEEERLLHQLLVGQNHAAEDYVALDQYLDSWTQSMNHVVDFGTETRADFREVANVELKSPYDIITDLSGGDFTFWRMGSGPTGSRWMRSVKEASSNVAAVVQALEDGVAGLSAEGRALKKLAREARAAAERWKAAGDGAWQAERTRLYQEVDKYHQAMLLNEDTNRAAWDVYSAIQAIDSHYAQQRQVVEAVQQKERARQAREAEDQAVQTVQSLYDTFRDRYQQRDARTVLRLMHPSWRASDGSGPDEVEETLGNSFRVFDRVTVTLEGLQVKPQGNGLFEASYRIRVVGEMTRKGIRHEEGGDVTDTVEVRDGKALILNTRGAHWVLGGE